MKSVCEWVRCAHQQSDGSRSSNSSRTWEWSEKQLRFFSVKARNWKPHVLCSKNGLHKKGKQQFALLVAESCYFLCFSFLFTQQCSQFVVAYFLVLTVGTFVHTFCTNLIRLIVCVSPCGLVRFNYVVIVVSANVFVFVCRTWLVEHFEWQIPIQQVDCVFHSVSEVRPRAGVTRHKCKNEQKRRNNNETRETITPFEETER